MLNLILKDILIVLRYGWDKVKWLLQGKPMIEYAGYHCGCCGRWIEEKRVIPTYQSEGEFCDSWGLCKECSAEDDSDQSS